ncbi:ferredoxin [Halobaculum magnesiiphilum]|uniref:Ferredoxin n=1 Tax=Halobaculum magnesiiphilum TaxID=1017351 RepID=A0A8T8WI94_9EURY|nr:ferredoxin [Halobaculum magnesiiphilum]QZP39602.1 ferredoxin [Halobaculum magnesiiphilum]
MTEHARYTVTVDRDACDGVFACLVRDPRFVEDDDGLAGIDPEAAASLERTDATVTATFADDRRGDAEQAAAACPLDAIAVRDAADAEVEP